MNRTHTVRAHLNKINNNLPVIEQSNRSVGADPEYWLIIPWECARGAGILNVIALWNFLLLGSTVTTGETATPCPNNFAVISGSIGWAWIKIRIVVTFHKLKSIQFYSLMSLLVLLCQEMIFVDAYYFSQ